MSLLLFSHKVMSYSFATSWTVAHQATLSVGFPRQEYWSALPFSSVTVHGIANGQTQLSD